MASTSVQTGGHCFPQEEIDAMKDFYGGMKCVVTLSKRGVEWAHILNPDDSSPPQLEWMLERKLRQDRHPLHATEVRENVVPMNIIDHQDMHPRLPVATLFLHEDIVARTLGFERDLKEWRQNEVQAGRGDPGRPDYEYVFLSDQGTQSTTPHRWYVSIHNPYTVRYPPGGPVIYNNEQCAGVDPQHPRPFPVIDTLLSIPFSLLHTVSRLSALFLGGLFRCDLVSMALEVIRLWHWDPVIPPNTQADTTVQRSPMPPPIYHPSRDATTFAVMRPPPANDAYTIPPAPAVVPSSDGTQENPEHTSLSP